MTVTARRCGLNARGAIVIVSGVLNSGAIAQRPLTPALHATSQRRPMLRNVMVIYGSARSPCSPVDIVIEI